jgi:hypothetical protein
MNFFGNSDLLARTGQRHTMGIIRTTVDDYYGGAITIPGQPIPVGYGVYRWSHAKDVHYLKHREFMKA